MIYGLDTSFLVQIEVAEQAGHKKAHQLKNRLLKEAATFALAPQTLCEFIHIVTDPKRFEHPLSADEAIRRSEIWWNLKEVKNISSTGWAVQRFHSWMAGHRLGRKRILDTMLAATFEENQVFHVITSDPAGFSLFKVFQIIDPLFS
jgi:predicted nucleic acid-binding protein